MSFDFHILYDFIIHTLQNWLPVNLITVTPISHKYANTIQTFWVLWEQKRLQAKSCRGPILKSLSDLEKICTFLALFFEFVKFPGSYGNMFCQNTACLLVTVNSIIENGSTLCCSHHCHFFWVVLFPLWLEWKQIEEGHNKDKGGKKSPCNLNENIVKIAQWRSGYIARNIILHSLVLCVPLYTSGSLL